MPRSNRHLAPRLVFTLHLNESLLREPVPAVIGVLVRRSADFASAEDAVQESMMRALQSRPDGPPRDAKAWLVAAA
ncbi:hypothetical protein GCM10010339_76250 [Streptomyces alanosinicus]|uniref:RNA polymerase sigma-70 region 2 domain-containing protein n=1 Tax=Streptomyces alanosinicus TaxID=68171 RepID=A0A918YQA4_9ACTN|nr:hypothetical protein GCM10010339_76250 [Streptomyces alanosinicus]